MLREPSIHITKSNFVDICNELEISVPINQFFQLAKRRAVNTRSITVSNKKLQRQVNKVTLADTGDAALFAVIIFVVNLILVLEKGILSISK